MGMVDAAKNMKRTIEDIRKPQLCVPSETSSSLPPWAWKAFLCLWRRLARKNPPKPHVIKPSSSSSLQVRPSCKRAKSGPINSNHHTKYASNNNYFYYSYPDHDRDYANTAYVCYNDASRSKVGSGLRASSGCATPTTGEHSPNLINMEHDSAHPYCQLHQSSQLPLPSATGRLPLYTVS